MVMASMASTVFSAVVGLAGEVREGADLVPQDPGDGGDRGHVVLVADAVAQQLVSDLPGEDARVLLLQVPDVVDHFGGGHPWLGTPDSPRKYGPGFVVPGQDLADASVANAQLAADVAGPDAQLGQLDDAHPDVVGQGAPIDENPSELVDLSILIYMLICKSDATRFDLNLSFEPCDVKKWLGTEATDFHQ